MRQPPFAALVERRSLADRLTTIDGVSIPEEALDKRPSFRLGLLLASGRLTKFLEAFDWVLSEIKKAETEPDPTDVAPPASSDHGAPA